MPVQARYSARLGLVVLIGASMAALTGCGSLDGASSRIANIVKPYRVDVVQGNFVSREQVEALQPGMSRQQVREILGTPLVTSLFHADRWEYVFTLKRPGEEIQTRKLTVFFKGDALERSEGDEMPTETEFVAAGCARRCQGQGAGVGSHAGATGQVPGQGAPRASSGHTAGIACRHQLPAARSARALNLAALAVSPVRWLPYQ